MADTIETARQLVTERRDAYRVFSRNWRLGYRFFLVLSALLSTGAAVVGKLNLIPDDSPSSDLAAILAALAAVVTTIIASLDFGVNWRANRAARHRTDMLLVESHKSDPDPDNVLDQLSAIIGLRLSESKKDD